MDSPEGSAREWKWRRPDKNQRYCLWFLAIGTRKKAPLRSIDVGQEPGTLVCMMVAKA